MFKGNIGHSSIAQIFLYKNGQKWSNGIVKVLWSRIRLHRRWGSRPSTLQCTLWRRAWQSLLYGQVRECWMRQSGKPGYVFEHKRLVRTCVICMHLRSGIESFLTPCVFCMRKKSDYPTAFYVACLNDPKRHQTSGQRYKLFWSKSDFLLNRNNRHYIGSKSFREHLWLKTFKDFHFMHIYALEKNYIIL